MRTWAILAQKGGQSKTTLAVGFAVEAAKEGRAVVILDADDRQGSSLFWGERREIDDVTIKDTSVAGLPLHINRAKISGKIDLTIIDTPANSKDIAAAAAELADLVIIPVAPRALDMHSVLQTVKQVQLVGTPFVVILCQVQHQGREADEAEVGLKGRGARVLKGRLFFRKDHYNAAPLGLTAAEFAPNGKAGAELRAAYAEVKRISDSTTKRLRESV